MTTPIKIQIIPGENNTVEISSTKIIPIITNTNNVIVEINETEIIPQIIPGNNPNLIVNPPIKIIPEILPGDTVNVQLSNFSNNTIPDEVYICGEDIPIYKVVYISQSGQAFIAGYDIPNSRDLVRGISTQSALMGEAITVRPFGTVVNNLWTWGSSGILYLQQNGELDIVPPSLPGSYIQKIAIIKSSMVILLEIDDTIGI